MTTKGQVAFLTLGQGHDLTQIGHVAYQSIRLDETNTTNWSWSLYLVPIKSYCQKTPGEL